MNRLLFFYVIAIAQFSFGQQYSVYINQGNILRDHQLPQVMIVDSKWGIFGGRCTGELVGPQVVLTAAHCCEAGDVNVKGQGRTRKWQVHPQFGKVTSPYYGYALPEIFAFENDLCVLELEKKVEEITPFSISSKAAVVNQEQVIVGVGENRSGKRQFGFVKVVKESERGIETESDLNYGRPGDSGGGLLSGNIGEAVELLGITSLSTHMCGFDKGAIFSPRNHFRCSNKKSEDPSEIFVPARTTGFASLRNSRNISFLRDYAESNHVEICGLNIKCDPVIFEP